MNFTAKDVSELRAQTGIGMMECKKALTEANGDKEEAVKILREKGLAVAEKKASRIAAEGIVDILSEGNLTAMIEVNSETDFVAKNETFRNFVKDLLKTILAVKPADVDALLAAKYVGSDDTVEAILKDKIFQIGEKLSIRRFTIVEGLANSYVHGGGTIGVIVYGEATTSEDAAKEIFKNLALQAAAMSPKYLDKDNVPAEAVDAEKEIVLAQIKNDEKNANKPEKVLQMMVNGKLGKFYETNCLMEQEYVKGDKESVAKYVADAAKAAGGEVTVKGFVRYEKGEGLEKREDNFAEEIAKLTGKQ